MHASLASIGRACTVEDEEPPETPSRSSIDSQTEYAPSEPRRSPALSLPLRDLIQRTTTLTKQTCIVPYFRKVIPVEQSVQEKKANEQEPCVSTGTPELISSPVEIDARLNRLSRLHRLCELVRKTIWLDSMAGVCNELNSSWINLSRQSDRITSKEYSNLDACNSSFSHIPKPVCQSSIRNANHYSATLPTCSGDSTRTKDLPQSDPYSFKNSVSTCASQLGELRVLCESLRQSLTQTKRFGHEQYTMHEQWRNSAGGRFSDVDNKTFSPLRLLGVCTTELTSMTLLSAHHLVFSGLSLLAHSDLTRFTHGDLWEMMRGMEELDILSRHIQTNRRLAHSISLRLFLTRNLHRSHGTCNWHQLLETDVFSRAITPFPSISVGYLFVILADQRSVRLCDTVFRQLCTICSHDQPTPTALEVTVGTPTQHRPSAEDEKPGRSHLVEAFRNYLHDNYGRSASEYLRSEYEFISGFLDVLSQSTNLLYHVEKLKLVCSAAAAAQSKKAELSRELQSMRVPLSPFGITTSSHAMSVEGKHGILIRRGSGEKTIAKQQQEQNFGSSSRTKERHKDVISYYQNTLHRACTLDRYVATGSTVCPLSEDTTEINGKTSHDGPAEAYSDTGDAQTNAEEQNADSQRNTKKSVQWSDHREISTRHQVIGRFLEMMWQYSEQRLNTMFLIPPEYQITSIQSCGLSNVPATHEPQSNWKLSSCLCLSPSKLHNFASKVQQVAKSDVFPAGLVPVLKRQALKLDELAHRRCYFSELLRLKVNTRRYHCPPGPDPTFLVSQLSASDGRCSLSTTQKPVTSPQSPGTAASSGFTESESVECVTSILNRLRLDDELPEEGSGTLCENGHSRTSHICSSALRMALVSTVQLLLQCAQNFSPSSSTQTEDTHTRMAVSYLSSMGFHTKLEAPLKLTGLQSSERVQSAYSICRRLSAVAFRLLQLISSIADNTTACYRNLLSNCLCRAEKDVYPGSIGLIRLVSRTALEEKATTAHLLAQCTLVHELVRTVVNSVHRYCTPHEQHISSPEEHLDTVTDNEPDWSINPNILSHLRLGIPSAVRFFKVFQCLRTIDQSITHLSSRIKHMQLLDESQFRNVCDAVLRQLYTAGSPFDANTEAVRTDYVDGLVDCFNDLSPLLTCTDRHASCVCPFHEHVYTSVCRTLFELFCRTWYNGLQSRLQTLDTSQSSFLLLNSTTRTCRLLIDSMLGQKSPLPVHLRRILQECDSFQQLRAYSSDSCEDLVYCFNTSCPSGCEFSPPSSAPNSPAFSVIQPSLSEVPAHFLGMPKNQSPSDKTSTAPSCSTPDCTADCSSVSSTSSSSSTAKRLRIKFANRLNAPTDAIAALAAGVRTSFMTSFKTLSAVSESKLTSSNLFTHSSTSPLPTRSPSPSPDHNSAATSKL
ncbi:hypothetical protein CRM22_007414 [Opisthorchis felineus]|uniref:Uncharacterized protein n=1 Tax=Opisthorchis felineus TaxID=147828 RepID=A0A4S2LMW9_OPIFE|nr:hypothetical protein CRM22_007414 [Opisthorchis felineus]